MWLIGFVPLGLSKSEDPGNSLNSPARPLIIGGGRASPGDYPWMVSLARRDEPDNFIGHFCGATVIHPYWVLTAAHCIEEKIAAEVDVVLETFNLQSSSFRRIPVVAIVQHPGYFDDLTFENDVALLQLQSPAGVSPIRLIDAIHLEEPGLLARTIGWGNNSSDLDNQQFDPVLRQVDLPLADRDLLNAPEFFNGRLTEDMLPAGFFDTVKSACFGDSGGPLLVRATSKSNPLEEEWVQVGITSWGRACGTGIPDNIYARVSFFNNWIANIVGQDETAFSPAIHNIASLDTASGYLFSQSSSDPIRSEATYYSQDYVLTDHPAGQTLTIALESGDFRGRLSIHNRATGEMLALDSGDSGRFDASITLIPQSNIDYLIRVSTEGSNESGKFVLHTFPHLSKEEVTTFETVSGDLSASDQVFPKTGYVTDAYKLTNVPGGRNIRVSVLSDDFDALLWLFDGASGEKIEVMDEYGKGEEEIFLFRTEGNKNYEIRVSHFRTGEFGDYSLSIEAFTSKSSISINERLQDFLSRDEDEIIDDGEDEPIIIDSFDFQTSESTSRTVDITLFGLNGLFASLVVIDIDDFAMFEFDTPNYRGVSKITFSPVRNHLYTIDVLGFLEDDGKNFLLDVELPPRVVNIPDTALESAIRRELEIISDGITENDLTQLTTLNASGSNISDLTGLETAQNLISLDLSHNQISDLSALSNLFSLGTLSLNGNQVSDIGPLRRLVALESLLLNGNSISNLSSLSGLTNLITLELDHNQITNLSLLSGLTNLSFLDLRDNQISDLSPLSGLGNLETLDVSDNLFPLSENSPALAFIESLQNGGTSVTFEPQKGDIFQGQPIDGFPGWRASPWYRNYNIDFWPWIFHDEHGWQFVGSGSAFGEIYVWDSGFEEWLFFNENSYRWIFLFGPNGGWIFSFEDNTPGRRFFQRLGDGSLFSIPPNLPVD